MNNLLKERYNKLVVLKEKGYTYDKETGEIKNRFGRLVTAKNSFGYIVIPYKKGKSCLLVKGHHFAWFISFNEVTNNQIDHINGNPSDNRINNLRHVTNQENHFNETKAKGYHWDNKRKKWKSEITLNKKNIYLGRFNTEIEARNAYLEAKLKYHNINE